MKKWWIWILAAVVLLAVLAVPVPSGPSDGSGTRTYSALTYKIVVWDEAYGNQVCEQTDIYWFPENIRSTQELWAEKQEQMNCRFAATVVEITGGSVTVEPLEGLPERSSSDRISFSAENLEQIQAQAGDTVEITYNGLIRESYPASIDPISWKVCRDLRHMDYPGRWLDPENTQPQEENLCRDVRITQIYADCFFAVQVIPMPDQFKFNGVLSEQWCVGDQVQITYENAWRDTQQCRVEADIVSVEESTFEIQPGVCYKPVIYLYPEQEQKVRVRLSVSGGLTCTYPAYDNGWTVTAQPDGTLTDEAGQTYNYLYWEGLTDAAWDLTEGFCVRGADTAKFLETALAKLGLSRREANEFIVYWLPQMQENPYNIISFQQQAYTQAAPLDVQPAPDTLIRVFMTWQPAQEFVQLPQQVLTAPERTGFTVVEWGGTEVPNFSCACEG